MIRDALRAAPLALALLLPVTARADDPVGFGAALAAADRRDWPVAVAEARKAGPLAAAVIDWERLRDGKGAFGEYVDFLARYPDWPGLPLLRKQGESSIAADTSADAVIDYFRTLRPQTGMGSLALIAAYQARGQGQAAEEEAVRAWRTLSLSQAEQDLFLARHASVLKDHHDGRTATMLRQGRVSDARRMLPLNSAYTSAVARARIALQASEPGVDALIEALPEKAVNSGGLAYDRFRWRIRKNFYDSADELLLERSVSAETLGDPEQWADWRRRLARKEMREGDARRAYRMAAQHYLTSGSDYADLEWLAGYIALRKLNDPKTALTHFDRFQKAVNGPISLSRAGYWRGRAYEALGMAGEAQAAYAEGARYPTAFYGLLSAEKVGLPLSPAMAGGEAYPDWRSQPFAGSSVLLAARELMAAGDETLAARFLLHLGEGLSGQEIGALAGMAVAAKEPYIALSLAKAAADKGVIWPSAYFPVPALSGLDLPVRPELALCHRKAGKRVQPPRHLPCRRARADAGDARHGRDDGEEDRGQLREGEADDRLAVQCKARRRLSRPARGRIRQFTFAGGGRLQCRAGPVAALDGGTGRPAQRWRGPDRLDRGDPLPRNPDLCDARGRKPADLPGAAFGPDRTAQLHGGTEGTVKAQAPVSFRGRRG